jgi:excisionase family DNA binding protein
VSDALLTAHDVAERLAVSAETVLRWTRRGMLPVTRLASGELRYRESELEAWLASRPRWPPRQDDAGDR